MDGVGPQAVERERQHVPQVQLRHRAAGGVSRVQDHDARPISLAVVPALHRSCLLPQEETFTGACGLSNSSSTSC